MNPGMRNHVLASLLTGAVLLGCASPKLDPLDGAGGGQDAQGPMAPGERCGNGMDDDGDGQIDEGCPCTAGAMQPCWRGGPATRGRGTCRDGQQACTSSGRWGECTGGVDPSAEKCGGDGNGDGIDQNCNGAVDDGCRCSATVDPKPRECPTPPVMGECQKGTQRCQADGKWSTCEGQVPPRPEICGNGKDEDCNGAPDDGCLPPPPDAPPAAPPDPKDAAAELPPPVEPPPDAPPPMSAEPPPDAPLATPDAPAAVDKGACPGAVTTYGECLCSDPKCSPDAVRLCDSATCGGLALQVCLPDGTWSACTYPTCKKSKPKPGGCASHLDCPRHELCAYEECTPTYYSPIVTFDKRWHCDTDSDCAGA